ncbi:MAG: hypothetical protein K2P34_06635 [Lachnospiraceae bacterium]|nr:hypothetical protein [Lachnospiraceae bacterium]
MLRKLIKYDFKALSRYLIVIHAMLLITAVLGRLLFVGRLMSDPGRLSNAGAIATIIGIIIYVILFMTAVFGTMLMIAICFYKNLYSDEGYLTHTLPVTRGQLLISKTVSGSVWMLLDMMMVILSLFILVLTRPVLDSFSSSWDELLSAMGFPASTGYGKILLAFAVLFIVSAVSNVVLIYVSITIGQLFSNHRVLGAVVVYFVINTIVSIISSIAGSAYSMSTFSHAADESSFVMMVNDGVIYQVYARLFLFSLILEIILAIGAYTVTYLLMQKKLNLN